MSPIQIIASLMYSGPTPRARAVDVACMVIVGLGDAVRGLVTDLFGLVHGMITAPFLAVHNMAEGAMTSNPELMAHSVICLEPHDADE